MRRRANLGAKRWSIAAGLLLCPMLARAEQPEAARTATTDALALCRAADGIPFPDRMAILSRGLQRAEEAVRANPQYAAAHFAVFCNLGKRAQLRRQALGLFGILDDLGRARREI